MSVFKLYGENNISYYVRVSNYNMYGYIFNNYTYYMNRNVIKVAGLSLMVVNSLTNFLKDMFILYNTLEKIGQRLYIF